jgi:hypothetical protein
MLKEVEPGGCFSFYLECKTCSECPLRQRCKSVTVTDGIEIVASWIEELVEGMPDDGQVYVGSEFAGNLCAQLVDGGVVSDVTLEQVNDLLGSMKNDYLKASPMASTEVGGL